MVMRLILMLRNTLLARIVFGKLATVARSAVVPRRLIPDVLVNAGKKYRQV